MSLADDLNTCPYCGARVEEPCDEPPPDTCEKGLEAVARAAYEAMPVTKPGWELLTPGGATQGVWRDRVLSSVRNDLADARLLA